MTEYTAKISAEEFMESLNGYDELAIEKQFGATWLALAGSKPSTLSRSLVFIEKRRSGLRDADAYKAVMEMTLSEVKGHFATDEEPFPDEPVTGPGKAS